MDAIRSLIRASGAESQAALLIDRSQDGLRGASGRVDAAGEGERPTLRASGAPRRLRSTLASVISATTLICLVSCPTALAAWGAGVEAGVPANAAANTGARVSSVSCASAGNCTAVGVYDTSSNGGTARGLLLTETAGVWSTGVDALLPANAGSLPGVSLPSVSCASAGNCTAVGTYDTSDGNFHGLLLTQTTGNWSTGIEPTLPTNAMPGFALLRSVSCASAGNCVAVGEYADTSGAGQGLLLSETAGTWVTGVEALPPANAAPIQAVAINSVSCASAGNCTAVGNYTDSSGAATHGLLLTETAGVWSTGVQAALPANAGPSSSLSSASCASAGNCAAVGSYQDTSGGNQGVMLTETAGAWSTGVEAALPANSAPVESVFLRSVSCSSPGNCAAVGTYIDSSNSREGLLLTQAADTWTTGVGAPLPANALSPPVASVNSVSCALSGSCTAVGAYTDNVGPNPQGLLVSSAKAPTSLAAAPQIATHGAVGLGVASATLTSGGTGVPGQKITFAAGSLQLCTATTNSKGTAICLISFWEEVFVLLNNRYSATYAATASYLGSTATTAAVTR